MEAEIWRKKRHYLLFTMILLAAAVFSSSLVSADFGTHLNVTLTETVYQNTTFAENFYLTESKKYCYSEGILNVTNPNTETVFDIYIRFTNIENLDTDFSLISGRTGYQSYGGAKSTAEYGLIGNTTNNVTLSQDLDNDGTNDTVWVNSTHVIFNLTSESGVIAIRLQNSTGNVDISNAGTTPVPIEMNEVNITGSKVYGNLTIIGTTTADNQIVAAVNFTVNEYASAPIVIYIPELRVNESSVFFYNISCMDTSPPLNIDSQYFNPRTGYNRKVLAGYNWTINQSVSNDAIVDITNINITMTAAQVKWNDSLFNFSLLYLNSSGDYAHVNGNGTNYHEWTWAPNGGTLAVGNNVSILYIMGAPESVPFTATYLALLENVSYQVNVLLSNLTIDQINASADIDYNFEKHITQPADNALSHNVTWEIRPNITVPYNITYKLNKVTLWVTQNLNPNNGTDSTIWGKLERNYTTGMPIELNLTTPWGNSSYYWTFNYTDGYNGSYPPPIVWMKPEWLISPKYGQILNYTTSVSGSDWYLKYIYVVHGYWLQIVKNVTNIGSDQYNITIYVENIGNGWTPQGEYVTVYDFVPNEFTAYDFSVTTNLINMSVGAPGSDFYGKSYRWNIPWKAGMNSSLGPKYGPYATGAANYSWTASYLVNGSGAYKVSELYIVGLDPLRVDGAFTSPIITIIAGIQSHSTEILYASIVMFLVIVNVMNLFMTNRIHKKLKQRMPPPPKPRL